MSPRNEKFDRFMADVRNGTNLKLATLSHAHFRAFFSAVLPIAAQSEVRGAFMVNGEPATEKHMRIMAPTLSVAECRSALDTFRAAGMLEHDDELGAEWVHDFEEWNPGEPNTAEKAAARQKAYRQRQRAKRDVGRNVTRDVTGDAGVTPSVTPSRARVREREKEVEVELTPTPFAVDFEEWVAHHEATTGHQLKRSTKAFQSVAEGYRARRSEGYTAEDLKLATVGAHADDYRREHGYDTADSILRPTKIASLIAKGKLRSGGGQQAAKSSVELARLIRGESA